MKPVENLHCGACMTDFDTIEELSLHIETCPAARVILPFIYQIWGGNDGTGHPLSHFITALHENAHLIKRYAYSIADKMSSLERSKIHMNLCKKLGLEYESFRPFESSDIKEFPDRDKAEEILWDAIRNELYKIKDNCN